MTVSIAASIAGHNGGQTVILISGGRLGGGWGAFSTATVTTGVLDTQGQPAGTRFGVPFGTAAPAPAAYVDPSALALLFPVIAFILNGNTLCTPPLPADPLLQIAAIPAVWGQPGQLVTVTF